ncbi:MAG: alpha-ketoglutarate-dependent dioxygenase AlkB [Deltaproteobacteria bacterium]|nr:alpha-ketoglutarate-dependent dioxygenase AlkB [Deltaproteobacteria bacterium]MBW2394890.1 alpha-ketoglutarate-dependent dioxygenase AlkB [Deltaproteobacteria bacterium]
MAAGASRSPNEALEYLNANGACVEYDAAFLEAGFAEALMLHLLEELEFDSEEDSRMRQPFTGRMVAIPRRQAGYGDPGTAYAFSGGEVAARPWSPTLAEVRALLRERIGFESNYVLVNHYRDGGDCMGWHSDDERDLGEAPRILSLSLGACRDFQFRRRGEAARDFETITLPLASGSLLTLRHPTNANWKHQLPRRGGKRPTRVGGRLNLTWRQIHR